METRPPGTLAARLLAAVTAATVLGGAGCTCQLSGTPLDTMEKQLNPACWFVCDDTDEGATTPTNPATATQDQAP